MENDNTKPNTTVTEGNDHQGFDAAGAFDQPTQEEPGSIVDNADADADATTDAPSPVPTTASLHGKLTQQDDEPRDNIHPAITVRAIKELVNAQQDWTTQFDPQAGILAKPSEKATAAVQVKLTQVIPVMKGPAKSREHVIENGIPQYKPTTILKDMPVSYDEEMVKSAMGSVVGDTFSKYVLEHMAKDFNKLVENPHYGRKMPVMAFNTPFKVSLAAVEAASGVSYKQFLENIFRAGWFKRSAKMQEFEMNVMCETPENTLAILAQKGDMIAKWKPSEFPQHVVMPATFKRVGLIVSQNFKYKGKKPQSAQLFGIVDCIGDFVKQYEAEIDRVDNLEQNIKAGLFPEHDELPESHAKRRSLCEIQMLHWATVICGVKGHAEQLQKVEEEKIAKVNADLAKEAAASEDGLGGLTDLYLPELDADAAL